MEFHSEATMYLIHGVSKSQIGGSPPRTQKEACNKIYGGEIEAIVALLSVMYGHWEL